MKKKPALETTKLMVKVFNLVNPPNMTRIKIYIIGKDFWFCETVARWNN